VSRLSSGADRPTGRSPSPSTTTLQGFAGETWPRPVRQRRPVVGPFVSNTIAPRGILTPGAEEPNAADDDRRGAPRTPTPGDCVPSARGCRRTARKLASLGLDLMAVNQLAAPCFSPLLLQDFMWAAKLGALYEPVSGPAGLGAFRGADRTNTIATTPSAIAVIRRGAGPARGGADGGGRGPARHRRRRGPRAGRHCWPSATRWTASGRKLAREVEPSWGRWVSAPGAHDRVPRLRRPRIRRSASGRAGARQRLWRSGASLRAGLGRR